MKFIVVTSPDFIPGEASRIVQLLEQGANIIHIRKPGATMEAYRHLINEIPEEWHSRLAVHDHFELASRYHLQGIHLNRRHPDIPNGYQGAVSCSCHSLEEVMKMRERCDYVFLSPVFDSISKPGYHARYTIKELQQAHEQGMINRKVIALGGVTKDKISLLASWGFGGYAMLGSIWK